MSGGGTPARQTTTTGLPDWAEPYAKEILGKTQALTNQPYQAPPMTPEERVAGLTPMEQQVRQQIGGMGPSPYLAQGAGIAGQAGQQALGAGQQYGRASAGDIASLRGMGAQLGQQLQPGIDYSMGAGSQLAQQLQPGMSYGMGAGQRLEGRIDPALQASLGAGERLQQRIDPGVQAAMGAGAQYGQMATDPGSIQAYMSPYMQNVVDIQQREAQRQADIARTGRGSQAVRAGAFGGSRQAIMEAEAQRNLAQQMGDIQARGSQQAFEQARQAQQFGADLGLRGIGQGLQAQQAAAQLGLSGLGQGLQAQQAAAQLGLSGVGQSMDAQRAAAQLGLSGVGQGMEAQRAAAQMGLSGTQAALAGTQFGSELGLRGSQAATQAGQVLGQLGQTQFGQQRDILGMQRELGQEERGLTQAMKDIEYEQGMAEQRYPYEQLGFFADMLRGVPVGQTSQSIYRQATPPLMSQLAGLGLAGYGMFGKPFEKGGEVKKMQSGGLAELAMRKFEENK